MSTSLCTEFIRSTRSITSRTYIPVLLTSLLRFPVCSFTNKNNHNSDNTSNNTDNSTPSSSSSSLPPPPPPSTTADIQFPSVTKPVPRTDLPRPNILSPSDQWNITHAAKLDEISRLMDIQSQPDTAATRGATITGGLGSDRRPKNKKMKQEAATLTVQEGRLTALQSQRLFTLYARDAEYWNVKRLAEAFSLSEAVVKMLVDNVRNPVIYYDESSEQVVAVSNTEDVKAQNLMTGKFLSQGEHLTEHIRKL